MELLPKDMYQSRTLIEKGGFGSVYSAFNSERQIRVAIKQQAK
jgi:serine/threonine protein kinase